MTDFYQDLIDALTPIVGRKGILRPVGQVEENEHEIRFPDALYWLVLTDDGTIRLEHKCIAFNARSNAVIAIDPEVGLSAEAIASKIDQELFQQIRVLIHQGYRKYQDGRFQEQEVWQKAFRRRMLLDIWMAVEEAGLGELFGSTFEEPSLLSGTGMYAVRFPLHDSFIILTAGDVVEDMDDEVVGYCLGYLTGILDLSQDNGDLDEFGISDWREEFFGKDEITERSAEEHDEFDNNQKEQLINVLPLSVLKAGNLLPPGEG